MGVPSLKKRKEMLVEAILAAEQRHGCKYEQDGQPVCVIGQLADICGIDVKEMPKDMINHFLGFNPLVAPLLIFGRRILEALQAVWDGRLSEVFNEDVPFGTTRDMEIALAGSEEDTRMLMLFMVEAWDGE